MADNKNMQDMLKQMSQQLNLSENERNPLQKRAMQTAFLKMPTVKLKKQWRKF